VSIIHRVFFHKVLFLTQSLELKRLAEMSRYRDHLAQMPKLRNIGIKTKSIPKTLRKGESLRETRINSFMRNEIAVMRRFAENYRFRAVPDCNSAQFRLNSENCFSFLSCSERSWWRPWS
jgi:hypothetical protein